MSPSAMNGDSRLQHFALPLPSLGIQIRSTPDELAESAKDALEMEASWGLGESVRTHLSEFSLAPVGSLLIASGRTTPVALQYKAAERVIVVMCYGGSSRFRDGRTQLRTVTSGMLVFPSAGGRLCGGFHSGISFSLELERLRRTARTILGGGSAAGLEAPFQIQGQGCRGGSHGLMFSLFRHLDCLFREDRDLPSRLCLDDQIYRTLVHSFAREFQLEPVRGVGSSSPAGVGCWMIWWISFVPTLAISRSP